MTPGMKKIGHSHAKEPVGCRCCDLQRLWGSGAAKEPARWSECSAGRLLCVSSLAYARQGGAEPCFLERSSLVGGYLLQAVRIQVKEAGAAFVRLVVDTAYEVFLGVAGDLSGRAGGHKLLRYPSPVTLHTSTAVSG